MPIFKDYPPLVIKPRPSSIFKHDTRYFMYGMEVKVWKCQQGGERLIHKILGVDNETYAFLLEVCKDCVVIALEDSE